MRRLVLLLAVMALALVLASGGVLAVNRIGTNGPDTLKGTNRADSLLGKGGNDDLFGLGGRDNLLGGDGKDWSWAATSSASWEATTTWWAVPVTMGFKAGVAQTAC
jgi:Ca2+-binding RTX toxin-like protein